MAQRSDSTSNLSKRKLMLFKVISIIVIPLLILIVFELVLRLFHYGDNLSLFIDDPKDNRYLIMNPDASKRYFSNKDIATIGNKEPFAKAKAANTIRIFVLGESTTIGYPYFHNGSFHRWLQYRLMHTYPDKNFEIINLSLTAVNSYTVLGFAREVVKYQPDAVLIYSGHNEFYGAMGAGSTQTIGGNPQVVNFILQLRELKLVQLLTHVFNAIGKLKPADGHGESRMQLMVAKQKIPYQSALYDRGIMQFKYNINETLQLFNDQHIPVLISNLVSNERDLKPFIDVVPEVSKHPDFKRNYLAGINAYQQKDYNRAAKYLQAANQQYNGSAMCNYALGQIAYLQGNYPVAKNYFDKARDIDALRFRASTEMNTILSQLCSKYPSAYLVNTKTAFEAYADHHIIGNELMTDHVHPNLKGYAIMSDVFYQQLNKLHLLPVGGTLMSLNQLISKMPITAVDSLAGNYRIANLKTKWPYGEVKTAIEVKSPEEQLAYNLVFNNENWAVTTDNLYRYYISKNNLPTALKVVEGVVLEYPTREEVYEKPAVLSARLNDLESSIFYFKKSFNIAPSFEKARYLFVLYLDLDKPAEAMPYIDYAIANNTGTYDLNGVKAYTADVINLKKLYMADSTSVVILNKIANDYIRMNNKIAASKYIKKVIKLDNKNAAALAILSQINQSK